jgi:pyridoxamine 5'-phosphate oxidase
LYQSILIFKKAAYHNLNLNDNENISMQDLSSLRREYHQQTLSEEDAPLDPLDLFDRWLQQAQTAAVIEPNAMVLATVDQQQQPIQRTVLLKGFDSHGFRFFTNLNSNKAQQIQHNAQVSLLFPWYILERQVSIWGTAQALDDNAAATYFAKRPRASQIGAWASYQSQPLASRAILEQQYEAIEKRFQDQPIPRPDFWGGFVVVPHRLEFWQGRSSRLHDRLVYKHQSDQAWQRERLSP